MKNNKLIINNNNRAGRQAAGRAQAVVADGGQRANSARGNKR